MQAGRLPWFLAGVAAAALAIGVGELIGGLLFGGTSIVAAIGALIISLQPPGGKDLMTQLFGTNDKVALEIMVTFGGLVVGGLLGLAARRDQRIATAGFVVFGAVALVLLMQDPLNVLQGSALVAFAATAAGLITLSWLSGAIDRLAAAAAARTDFSRRGFIAMAAFLVVGGSGLAAVGRLLGGQVTSPPITSGQIPSPRETVAPVAAAADFSTDPALAGISPIVVPNADFYRIDTRLSTPRIDSATWTVRVHGMVDREITLTYDELLARPLVERYVTIACVSNEVGGNLVGNARWTGTSLVDLLAEAGVQAGASQVVGRSFDGWTSGFPTAHLSGAGSEAMVVVAMNGEPLPPQHGFPARLIVPGLFGYVSATKWLTEIELTTLEAFDAYWVPLGWAKEGPILTQSRVDRPVYGAFVKAGSYDVAGVAWAPTRAISKVEVRLDTGDWQQAQISQPLSSYSWVQWRATFDVAAGPHTVSVRATDGTGETQPEGRTTPAPSGARGWHQVQFSAG